MTRLIASSQIRISKKPNRGAILFMPFVVKIILSVPRETSQILAKKIKRGRRRYVNSSELMNSIIQINIFELAKL